MDFLKFCAVLCMCVSAVPGFAGVTIASPGTQTKSFSPVHFVASGSSPKCSKGIAAMGIYTAPGALAYVSPGAKLDAKLRLKAGTHNVAVQQWDHCGWSSKVYVNIRVAASSTSVPHSDHIWIITEENHSYEEVIGNSSMPYFNSLASKYAVAAEYYADRHSSLPALMRLVAGQDVTIYNATTRCFNDDNIVRHLLFHGMTWKSYQEDLPYSGYQGIKRGDYVRRHNPLIDFADSCASGQKLNSVPLSHLKNDIANHNTPNYAYITPNLQHDAHDGTRSQADAWLAKHVPHILSLPQFQSGGDGLLFIVFDEGHLYTDHRCSATVSTGCGGRVATLVIGPKVQHGYKSQVLYHHENLLRTVCDAFGFPGCPGGAATAKPMADLF